MITYKSLVCLDCGMKHGALARHSAAAQQFVARIKREVLEMHSILGADPARKFCLRSDEEHALCAKLAEAEAKIKDLEAKLAEDCEPIWIVNDSAELGVKVGDRFFFLYKGDNIEYEDAEHDDGSPMFWRIVGKREFGEVCYPIKTIANSIKHGTPIPFPYTQELSYDPLLSFGTKESGEWKLLPARKKGAKHGE